MSRWQLFTLPKSSWPTVALWTIPRLLCRRGSDPSFSTSSAREAVSPQRLVTPRPGQPTRRNFRLAPWPSQKLRPKVIPKLLDAWRTKLTCCCCFCVPSRAFCFLLRFLLCASYYSYGRIFEWNSLTRLRVWENSWFLYFPSILCLYFNIQLRLYTGISCLQNVKLHTIIIFSIIS